MTPFGTYGYGGSKVATSGSTTVTMTMYPREAYAGWTTAVGVDVGFVGGLKSVRIDYGDGTVLNANLLWEWYCEGHENPKTTHSIHYHGYSQPGTYTVTVTATTVDCTPPGHDDVVVPPFDPTQGSQPQPVFPVLHYPALPVGHEQVTTVSMQAISSLTPLPTRPSRRPPAERHPPPGGLGPAIVDSLDALSRAPGRRRELGGPLAASQGS